MGYVHNSRLREYEEENYTQIYNALINGKVSGLSIDARMVLIICLSFIDGWEIHWDFFEREQNISKKRRLKALRELADKGYYIEHKYKPSSQWIHEHYFFGYPLSEEEQQQWSDRIRNQTMQSEEDWQ